MAELLTPLSADEAITRMRTALDEKDIKAVWCLYTMDTAMMPDWDAEAAPVWHEWEDLIEEAEKMLNI